MQPTDKISGILWAGWYHIAEWKLDMIKTTDPGNWQMLQSDFAFATVLFCFFFSKNPVIKHFQHPMVRTFVLGQMLVQVLVWNKEKDPAACRCRSFTIQQALSPCRQMQALSLETLMLCKLSYLYWVPYWRALAPHLFPFLTWKKRPESIIWWASYL